MTKYRFLFLFILVFTPLVAWRASVDGTYEMEWDPRTGRYLVWKNHFFTDPDLIAMSYDEDVALRQLEEYKRNPPWTKTVRANKGETK